MDADRLPRHRGRVALTGGTGGRPGWWLGGALAAALGAALLLYADLHRLSGRVDSVRPLLERARIRDRLLQRRLPDLRLPAVGADTTRPVWGGPGPHLVVTVDPERCVDCLEGLAGWSRAVHNPGVEAVMVLEGVDRTRGAEIVTEAGIRGTVLVDPEAAAGERFGWSRSTGMAVLTVDAGRTVRSVAVRRARGGCRWSALGRAVALLGAESPSPRPPVSAAVGRPEAGAR